MAGEKPPRTKTFLLEPVCAWLVRLSVRRPVAVVAISIGLAVVSIIAAKAYLGFKTSRLDLLNPKCSHNQLWIDYINEFGAQDDVVVVVEGANRDVVVPVLDELSRAISKEDRYFSAVLHEVDLSRIRAKGLHYLPLHQLQTTEQFLDKVIPIVEGNWAQLSLCNLLGGVCSRLEHGSPEVQAASRADLARLTDSLLVTLRENGRYQSAWPGMPESLSTISELGSEYLLANDGRLGLVLLRLNGIKEQEGSGNLAQGTKAIDTLRGLIDRVADRYPEIKVGLTGLPIMENDEMRVSQRGMTRASILSLFGVCCLFIAGFGGIRHPVLTVFALLIGIAWSFGYITLAIGHLNILSIAFGAILIGLGIDFGVHFAARYLQLRGWNRRSDESLIETAKSVGPGVVTGAITTAIAFFTAGLTEFTGVAELGMIAGGGILLCCLSAVFVLPAMIQLMDGNRTDDVIPVPLDIHGCLLPLFRRPRMVLAVSVAVVVACAVGMVNLEYDHNLLNLQPVGLESVEMEKKLLAQSDQSVWFALSIAESREELLERKSRFLAKNSVERVEEIASLLPTDIQDKTPIVAGIHRRLETLPERPPRIPIDTPEKLGRLLERTHLLLGESAATAKTRYQLEQIRASLRQLSLPECYERLSDFQHRTAGDLLSRLHALRAMSNPDPPRLDDLPKSLVERFVGENGRYLLKIYSKADIWDMDAMEQFVSDVRSVDACATGNPLQTYEASRQMKESYELAALYAFIAIAVVLAFDLGNMLHFCLAILPLAFGVLQLFGILGLLGIPLNPANMIVLPLILGIGVDDGVHVIHDFRRQKGRYHMSPSTASAVLITSLTTMVGFGSLMIASHQGLQSLGRVLTLGVSCCLFTSLIILPAILILLSWNRPELDESDEIDAHPHLRSVHPRLRSGPHFPTGPNTGSCENEAEEAVRPVRRR